jgi:invasion protein IalB
MTYYDRQEPRLYHRKPVSSHPALRPSGRIAERRKLPWLEIILLVLLALGSGFAIRYLMLERPQQPTAPASPATAAPSVAPQEAADMPAAAEQAPPEQPGASETPSTFTSEAIGDWMLICPSDASRARCIIQQRLAAQGGGTAFIWTITRDEQGVVRAVWQTPADVNPEPGMAIDLGDGQPRTVPFEACESHSCRVKAVLAPVYLDALVRATSVSAIVMVASSGQLVRYRLGATGLATAISRL